MKGYFSDMYQAARSLSIGLSLTLKHLFQKTVTMQYPDEKWELPPMAKGQLHNVIEDCIGCDQCAKACPVDCIAIETIKAPSNVDLGKTSTGNPKRLHVLRFDIDMAKCCYCALCTVPCPTECLVMTNSYENSVYDRMDLIYHYAEYTPQQAAALKQDVEAQLAAEAEEKKKAMEAKKAAAAKVAAEKAATEKKAAPKDAAPAENPDKKPDGEEG